MANPSTDFVVSNHGSIFLVEPQNADALAFVAELVSSGDAQRFGRALVVEHRFIGDVVTQLVADGWEVR